MRLTFCHSDRNNIQESRYKQQELLRNQKKNSSIGSFCEKDDVLHGQQHNDYQVEVSSVLQSVTHELQSLTS